MDSATNGTIENYSIKIDNYGYGKSWGFAGKAPQSMQILPMIESRVRSEVDKQVVSVKRLASDQVNEVLASLGIKDDRREANRFIAAVIDQHRERLVYERMVAIADRLAAPSETPDA